MTRVALGPNSYVVDTAGASVLQANATCSVSDVRFVTTTTTENNSLTTTGLESILTISKLAGAWTRENPCIDSVLTKTSPAPMIRSGAILVRQRLPGAATISLPSSGGPTSLVARRQSFDGPLSTSCDAYASWWRVDLSRVISARAGTGFHRVGAAEM